jgi:hypothetical protein
VSPHAHGPFEPSLRVFLRSRFSRCGFIGGAPELPTRCASLKVESARTALLSGWQHGGVVLDIRSAPLNIVQSKSRPEQHALNEREAPMPTSGPIVRTGATPEFWKNWDNIFGGKKKGAGAKAAPAKPAAKKKTAAKKPAAGKSKSARRDSPRSSQGAAEGGTKFRRSEIVSDAVLSSARGISGTPVVATCPTGASAVPATSALRAESLSLLLD